MRSIVPLSYRLRRLLAGKRVSYQELSYKSWEISPEEERQVSPALCLDGELERVSHVSEFTTWEIENDRILGTRRRQQATRAFRLKDVQIIDGYMYKGAMKEVLVTTPERLFPMAPDHEVEAGVLACTYVGNRFFGHCLRDDFPLALLAYKLGEPLAVKRRQFGHEPGYRELCAISVPMVERVRCRDLTVIDDIGYTASKRERLQALRGRLHAHGPSTPPSGVMIRRGRTGESRALLNEDEIEERVAKQGFVIIDPGQMSASEIVRTICGAPIVMGVEGSHMNHGLLNLGDHGAVLTLQPPYRFNNVFKEFTDCLDMRYAFLVGTPEGDGFVIEPDRVEKTLDLLRQRILL